MLIKIIISIIIGYGFGMVVGTGISAFFSIIKVVPCMAKKTKTKKYVRTYENALMLGTLLGGTTILFNYYFPIGNFFAALFSLLSGIFIGVLSMCLAEVFDVMPIMMKRFNLRIGIKIFVIMLALGKLTGSIIYFYVFRLS